MTRGLFVNRMVFTLAAFFALAFLFVRPASAQISGLITGLGSSDVVFDTYNPLTGNYGARFTADWEFNGTPAQPGIAPYVEWLGKIDGVVVIHGRMKITTAPPPSVTVLHINDVFEMPGPGLHHVEWYGDIYYAADTLPEGDLGLDPVGTGTMPLRGSTGWWTVIKDYVSP